MSAQKLIIEKDHKVKGVIAIDKITGKSHKIRAKKVINATGVFSDNIRRQANGNLSKKNILSKGEHVSLKMIKKITNNSNESII